MTRAKKPEPVPCKTMEELIERAKAQVKAWYSPRNPTKREFIETDCVHLIPTPEHQNKGKCKIFILEGGEPKGTVIANYHDGTVVTFDYMFKRMKIYRLERNSIHLYEEKRIYIRRKEHLTPEHIAEGKEIEREAKEWYKEQRKVK